MPSALKNIIFWVGDASDLPSNTDERIDQAMQNMEVFIDPKVIGEHGEIAFDLTGVSNIHLASEAQRQSIITGDISLLDTGNPPPGLIERIDGCCLDGAPPGRRAEIMSQLERRKLDKHSAVFLNLVIDSATDTTISKSDSLRSAARRAKYSEKDSFQVRLSKAIEAASGQTLIILAHVEDRNIVARDSAGHSLFSAPIKEIAQIAAKSGVDLILFGCETASLLPDVPGGVGISGKYNTVYAARKIDEALLSSNNHSDFMKKAASEGLLLVASETMEFGPSVTQVDVYDNKDISLLARLFRLFSFGKSKLG